MLNTLQMVKLKEFHALTFKPQLYTQILTRDIEHIEEKELAQEFNIEQLMKSGMLQQNKQCIFLYQQQFKGHVSLGLIGQLSVNDFQQKKIKKHEHTIKKANQNQNKNIAEGHVPPVVVGHRFNEKLDAIINSIKQSKKPFAQWNTIDGRKHKLWMLNNYKQIIDIYDKQIQTLYILDGHHRFRAAAEYLQKQGTNIKQRNKWLVGILYSAKYIQVYPQYRELIDQKSQQIVKTIMKDQNLNVKEIKEIKEDMDDCDCLLIHKGKIYCISLREETENNEKNENCSKMGVQILNEIFRNLENQNSNILSEKYGQNRLIPFGKQTEKEKCKKSQCGKQNKLKIQYMPSIIIDGKDKKELLERKNPIFIFKAPELEKIFEYGDKGLEFPPKSTWLEPKPCLHMVARSPY